MNSQVVRKQSEPSLLSLGPRSNWNLGGHGDYRVKKKRTEFVFHPRAAFPSLQQTHFWFSSTNVN